VTRAAPSRRIRHRTEVRERLYREALRLFALRGFAGTTVEDITEAADVGKGTFFNYFPSKEDVLATLGAQRMDVIRQAREEAREGKHSIRQVLDQMNVRLAQLYSDSPELARCVLVAHASNERVRSQLTSCLGPAREMIADIFRIGQKRAEIRKDLNPLELSRIYQKLFMGVVLVWSLYPEAPLARLMAEARQLIWPGIEGRRAGKARRA
jgi:AcrR family transcriptional regulator